MNPTAQPRAVALAAIVYPAGSVTHAQHPPNILVIWGDDIG
jgi:hypothetical protein